jgi:trigger factor
MSNRDDDDQVTSTDEGLEAQAGTAEAEAGVEAARKIDLAVDIQSVGPCKKHLKITIPREEVDRQFGDSLKSMRREAAVPGFRPGRAPATLVQKRFKKEVEGQVKNQLLMAALQQVDDDHKINPISRPELDLDAIELAPDGPLTFEMDVEVQPEFDLPTYKGLTVQRPVRKVTDADLDAQFRTFLERYAQEVPKLEGGADAGDLIVADLTFEKDGVQLNQVKEVKFRLLPALRLQDGVIEDLQAALAGAKPGERREAVAQIGTSSPDPAIRGQAIRVVFNVLDLKTLRLPEVNEEFLSGLGFDDEAELRDAMKASLERRVLYQQAQAVRGNLLNQLVGQVPIELPSDLVKRQESTTLRNMVLEMRQAGLSDAELRAREAEIRANAHETTLRNLKEFFLLSRIAEAEGIKVDDDDLDREIDMIAMRTEESPRRIRARIEKEGLADGLATQILERRVIDFVLESATIEDVAVGAEADREVETVDQTASSADAAFEAETAEEAATAADDQAQDRPS